MTSPWFPATIVAAPVRPPNPEVHKLASYPMFDWLRLALASVVALSHEGMPDIGPIDGNLAVIVFLALSGWLIGGILLATPMAELPRFFFNRATRIWLPYAFAVLLIYGLAVLREGASANWLKYLFYDTTFTHITFTHFPRAAQELPLGGTGNHFWSISVEEQFYLAAPLAMLLLPWGKSLWVWALVAAFLLWAQSIFAAIGLGVLAAVVARDFPGWDRGHGARLMVQGAAVLAFALVCRFDTPALRALFAVLLVQALAVPGPRDRLGMFAGAISYPFYLNHWMGAFLVNGLLKHLPPVSPALAILASYGIALVAGVVAWAMIDRRVMQRRNGWYTPRRGLMLGFCAYGLLAAGLAGGTIIDARGG